MGNTKEEMKTFVLTVSKQFPKTHPKSGIDTGFVENISMLFTVNNTKIHTIRGNYELWDKRAKAINDGKAILSVRYWSGKPYNSKQVEICRLEKIGIEKILFDDYLYSCQINDKRFSVASEMIAENDGLTSEDFEHWFKGYDFTKPMAIIHFTNFKYNQ